MSSKKKASDAGLAGTGPQASSPGGGPGGISGGGPGGKSFAITRGAIPFHLR